MLTCQRSVLQGGGGGSISHEAPAVTGGSPHSVNPPPPAAGSRGAVHVEPGSSGWIDTPTRRAARYRLAIPAVLLFTHSLNPYYCRPTHSSG